MSGVFPRWHEITAIFGGTFDPPHLGHREAVKGLFTSPGVARVLILPSPLPPHKPSHASTDDRVTMTRLNFGSTPGSPYPSEVSLDLRELERARRTPGRPTYTFDTLQELSRDYSSLAFVIGTDQLESFPTWYRFPEILGLAHWIVLERKPEGAARARRILTEWESSGLVRKAPNAPDDSERTWKISQNPDRVLRLAPTDARQISSTTLRESLGRSGGLAPDLLLPEVLAYLKQKHLYGTKGETKE